MTTFTLQSSSGAHEVVLSPTSMDILRIMRDESHCKAAIDFLLAPSRHDAGKVDRTSLVSWLQNIANELTSPENHVPYRYTFRMSTVPVSAGNPIFSSGGGIQGGFHVQGRTCQIMARLGTCVLTIMNVDEAGCLTKEYRDLRGLRELETDDFGPIDIQRRRADKDLRSGLTELIQVLSEWTDDTVFVTRSM